MENVRFTLNQYIISEKSQKEQIEILAKAGIAPKDIAQLLGTTPNTVRVVLSKIRKASNKGASRNKKKG